MKTPRNHESAKAAILVLAEIKSAVERFDRGEVNVLAAVEAVRAAVAPRAAMVHGHRGSRSARRRAA